MLPSNLDTGILGNVAKFDFPQPLRMFLDDFDLDVDNLPWWIEWVLNGFLELVTNVFRPLIIPALESPIKTLINKKLAGKNISDLIDI